MVVAKRPKTGWQLEGRCPACERATALTLHLAGGQMPTEGASVQLDALCKDCGHVWSLPPASGASRGSG